MVFMDYHLINDPGRNDTDKGLGSGKEDIGQGAYLICKHNYPRKTQETNGSECPSFSFYFNPKKENHLSADHVHKGPSPIVKEQAVQDRFIINRWQNAIVFFQ